MDRLAQQEKRVSTRDEIVRVGSDMIGRQGFNHTGLDAILKTAGIPKGSFYHYFSSKEDFGLAVIDEFARDYELKLDRYLGSAEPSPLARLRALFESSIGTQGKERCKSGCLIGNLGQEMAGQHERFRQRIDAVFKGWEERFADCLDMAQRAGELPEESDTETLSKVVLSGWEGAILRSKVTKSVQPMRDFIDVLFGKVLA